VNNVATANPFINLDSNGRASRRAS